MLPAPVQGNDYRTNSAKRISDRSRFLTNLKPPTPPGPSSQQPHTPRVRIGSLRHPGGVQVHRGCITWVCLGDRERVRKIMSGQRNASCVARATYFILIQSVYDSRDCVKGLKPYNSHKTSINKNCSYSSLFVLGKGRFLALLVQS